MEMSGKTVDVTGDSTVASGINYESRIVASWRGRLEGCVHYTVYKARGVADTREPVTRNVSGLGEVVRGWRLTLTSEERFKEC